MATKIISSEDGPRLTVNDLMKSPTLIPRRILNMADQMFLTDAVLRKASDTQSGSVLYAESTPLFAEDDPAILDEFGEIPTTNGSVGTRRVARSVRRALGLRVSKTMRDRNARDAVDTQIIQIRNTMVRAWEDALFSAIFANASVQSMTVGTAWSAGTGTHIRGDLNAAKFLIKTAAADSAGKQRFGYKADTLILSDSTEIDFLDSDEVNNVYVGNIASESVKYKGVLPKQFNGLDVLISWRLGAYFPNAALVCQRKVFGGISDERPLSATPMYGEGGGPNGGPTESWRTDVTRASAVFLDQPQAVVMIWGVNGADQWDSATLPNVTVNADGDNDTTANGA
jgi:hypothetical protein